MNTKTTKFLAVLAVLAMAFGAFAATSSSDDANATATSFIDFNATADWSTYYSVDAGTYTLSNSALGNVLKVKEDLTTEDYPIYYVSGYFSYITGSEASDSWKMIMGSSTNGNAVVFKMTIPADMDYDYVYLLDADTYSASAMTKETRNVDESKGFEPYCWYSGGSKVTSGNIMWVGYGTDDSIVAYAKIVFGTEGTYTHYGASGDVIVNADKTAVVDGSSADVIVTKTSSITATTDANGLVKLGSGKNLFVAPGVTLTINASGASPGTSSHFNIIKAEGTAGSTTTKIFGGVSSAIVIEDGTTLSGTLSSGESSTVAINTAGNLAIKDISLTIRQTAKGTFGTNVAGSITIENSTVSITSENRALYNQHNSDSSDIVIKGDSNVALVANEVALKSYFEELIIGSAPVTSEGVTTYDNTIVRATLSSGQSGNEDPDDFHGVKLGAAPLTIYEGATLTTSDLEIVYAGASTVNGTLNILGSNYAGLVIDEKLWVPAGLIIVDSLTSEKKLNAVTNSNLVITSTGVVNIAKGAAIFGIISDGVTDAETSASTVKFGAPGSTPASDLPSYINISANTTLSHGSVVIKGSYTTDSSGKIIVTGNAEISGVLDAGVTIELSTAKSVLTVPSGETLTINGTINATTADATVNVVGTANGTGKIGSAGENIKVIAVSESAISGLEGDKATYTEPSNAELDPTGMTIDAIQEFLNNNLYVKIVKANISIAAGKTLTLPSSLKLDLGGKAIVIADKGELDVNGAIIVDSVGGGYIEVGGIMVIDAADVCVDVKLDAEYKGYISVKNPKIMSVSGSLTSDVSVGYGNTMTLTDVTVPAGKNVFAYGKVVFEGTTTVKANANVYIYNYGSAVVNGSLYIEGSASSTSSSFTVNGLLEISNDNGAATMTAKAIYNMGTINVVKPRSSTAVNSNSLTATTVYNYSTTRVTGEFAGKIYDFGELTFNGTNTSAETKIVLADGITFTLTSVTGQPLTVMDEGSYTTMPDAFVEYTTTPKAYVAVSAGNAVVLKDVKNVTFTESVSIKIVEGKYAGETANIRCFTANLTVAGSVVATDDSSDDYKTIGMTGMTTYKMDHATGSSYKVSITKGLVIVDDMTVGKNVELTMNAGVKVSGTLTATAKTSRVVAADADNKVDVTGMIIIGDECGKTGAAQGLLVNTNSAYYEVTDLDSKTYTYYTTLKTALDNASFADDDNIGLLGAVSIKKAELIVPAGITLRLAEGSKLTISSTGSLEVEKDALLNAINGEVVVDGVLQIDDKNTGFRFNTAKLTYQVYVENGDMAAYCGLLGALAAAEPGDIITLVQSKTVKESFTIPEGVVVIVPTNIELTLGSDSSKIKMTVDGTLVLERNSKLTKATSSQEVIITISGQIVKDTDATITATAQTTTAGKFTLNDYATYTGKIEGRDTLFYSNLTDAIENATSGYVTVYGKVSAGEVTLTKGETATTLDLIMVGSDTAPAVISVVSLTLDGSSITILNNQYTTFNGTIIAASGDDYGEIIMSNAYDFTVVSGYEVTSSGNVDYMELSGTPEGSVMISDGIVTAADHLALSGNSNGTFILDEDATLYVPEDCSVGLGSYVADAEYNIIDGSVVVEKGTLYLGSAIVSGSISIIESTTSVVELPVLLTGSIITVSTDDNKALLTIDDEASIIMGDRPEVLADTPVLAGDFAIENGAYILIYEGDISLAKMNWNSATEKSDVKSTSFYINDELFCTAIGGSSPTVDLVNDDGTIYDTIIYDVFELEGLDTSKIATASEWKNIEGRSIGVQYIGYTDAIFFKADAAIAKGTVSVGIGLVLYIDGVGYNYYGGDNVKLTVGTHSVRYEVDYGYIGDNVVLTFNGKTIPVTATGATIDVTPDMVEDGFFVSATGATPAPEPEPVVPEKESEWTITTILLCVLVVLIAIMAVIVALRLNRN